MEKVLPILFASIAAVGNAIFALGQKKSASAENGLLFMGLCAFMAFMLSLGFAPWMGRMDVVSMIGNNGKALCLSGVGLFLTYLGFNLLYTRFGVSQYILYAVISIITTTIIVGFWWLKEPANIYHMMAVALAVGSVVFFSLGQLKG